MALRPQVPFFSRNRCKSDESNYTFKSSAYGASHPIDLYHMQILFRTIMITRTIMIFYQRFTKMILLIVIVATTGWRYDRSLVFLSLSLHSTKELYHNILYECMIACIVHNWNSPQPQKNSGNGLYSILL